MQRSKPKWLSTLFLTSLVGLSLPFLASCGRAKPAPQRYDTPPPTPDAPPGDEIHTIVIEEE